MITKTPTADSASDEPTRITTIQFNPAPPNAPPVILKLPDGSSYRVAIDGNFDQVAAQAAERVRSRKQWRKITSAREFMFKISGKYLADFGSEPKEELKKAARAGVIEVQIPAATGESAHLFPWEFALSELTAEFRTSQPLLVVRHLDGGPAAVSRTPAAFPVLIVQSAPGPLGEDYSFESEQNLVTSSFGDVACLSLNNPTVAELQNMVVANSPGTIHFAGIDGLQGSDLLNLPDSLSPGMFLSDDLRNPVLVNPTVVSGAVTFAATKPLLVSYNFYNSSWPLASLTVLAGAGASVGFQDEIDDSIAELFFACLYEAWQRSNWNLLYAYRQARNGISDYSGKLAGTGIVLCSATSLLPSVQTSTSSVSSQTTSPESILLTSDTRFVDVRKAIEVVVKPREKLNYSMLHNNRPLFDKFEVKRQASGRLLNVRVDVALNTGSDVAQYSRTFDLSRSQAVVDVSTSARVSLTSDMVRSLRESVYTSLMVSVTWEDKLVYQETSRVALLPPDEWCDDDLNRMWLPSFVLPRDLAIAQIVDNAQRYLCALQDDSGSGFDGYQGVLPTGDAIDRRCQSVDDQVRALWWSLIQEYHLGYINPPPSFTEMSQRLRTPTDTIEGRRGTCIDLTILLAALLEYVDIYPVIFLLQGHAFPGYLRSEDSWKALRTVFLTPPPMTGDMNSPKRDTSLQNQWTLDQRYYSSVVGLVRSGDIVPIESVALTQHSGFAEAIEQGTENFRNKSDFECLVDIKGARKADVTPIPMWSMRR